MIAPLNIQTKQDWQLWLTTESPSIQNQLHRWLELVQSSRLDQSIWQSCEMRKGAITILMRDRTNGVTAQCLTIGTVRLPENMQRKGWLKSFLNECCLVNPWHHLIIEDVENSDLRGFLERLNSVVLSDSYRTTYIINKDSVFSLNAGPLLSDSNYA